MINRYRPLIILVALVGCAAAPLAPEAREVVITSRLPPKGVCRPVGDVVGSQGNWITGDYTTNENLMIGARNTLKNQAANIGGNVVVVQSQQAHQAWGSLGTSAYSLMGTAFKCGSVDWTFESQSGS